MANFNLANRIKIVNPSANVDVDYGPYDSLGEATTAVVEAIRVKGKTVGIIESGSVVEYWFKDGVTDGDLVEKTSGGGSGTLNMSGDTVGGLTTYVDATTICANSGITFSGDVLSVGETGTVMGKYFCSSVDDNGIQLHGSCDGLGANIELYGSNHATLSGRSYYDASLHTFRTETGGGGVNVNIDGGLETDTIKITTGAATGCVLTSDTSGNGTWSTPSSGGGGIVMSGDTVGGLTTYVDATTVCAAPYLQWDGNNFNICGDVNETKSMQLGAGRTGSGYTYIDFVGDTTYSDYGLRIIRNADGANAHSMICHRGTGRFDISTAEVSDIVLATNNVDAITIDGTTQNVGIGTITPSSKLDIQENTINTTALFIGRHNDENQAIFSVGENDIIGTAGTAGIGLIHARNRGLGFSTENAAFGDITDVKMAILQGGNVGIGTSSPASVFQVEAASIDYAAYIYQKSGAAATSGGLKIRTSSTGVNSLLVNNAGTDLFVVEGGGNVGIGTSSPSQLLDIVGTTAELIIEGDGTGTYYYSGLRIGSGEATNQYWTIGQRVSDPTNGLRFDLFNGLAWVNTLALDSTGNVGIGTTTPILKTDISGEAGELVLPATSGADPTGILRVGYKDRTWTGSELNFGIYNGGTYPAWIQSQNPADHSVNRDLLLNPNGGNVGIGTATPTNALDIKISNDNDQGIIIRDEVGDIRTDFTLSGTLGNRSGRMKMFDSDGNQDVQIHTGQDSWFNGGNVGIGTTSPISLLDVKADNTPAVMTIRGGLNTVVAVGEINSQIDFGQNDGSLPTTNDIGARIANVTEYNNGGRAGLAFYTGNADPLTERLRITYNGNVGIGTTVPSQLLDIVGTSAAPLRLERTNNYNLSMQYVNNSSSIHTGIGLSNNYYVSLGADLNTTALLTVATGGNVGIGTDSPDYKLDVSGDIRSTGTILTKSHRPIIITNNSIEWFKLGTLSGSGARVKLIIHGQNGYSTENSNITEGVVAIGNADNEYSAWQYTIGTSTSGTPNIIYKDEGTASSVDVYIKAGSYFSGSVEIVEGNSFTLNSAATTAVADPSGVNATQAMSIRSNVGIGTSSPQAPLHAYYDGNLYVRLESTNDSNIEFWSDAAAKFIIGYDAAPEGFRIYDQQGTAGTRFFVQSITGNVGIGTTSPEALLHVGTAGPVARMKLGGYVNVAELRGGVTAMIGGNVKPSTTVSGQLLADKAISTGVGAITLGGTDGINFYTSYAVAANDVIDGIKMTIERGGNVGIDDTSPSYKLDVNGTFRATTCVISPVVCATTAFCSAGTGYRFNTTGCGTAADWVATSDCRIKDCIEPITSALSKVDALCGVCYELCEDNTKDMGLIAQDVLEVEPRLVTCGEVPEEYKKYGIDDEMFSLKYDKFAGLFVEAIKELKIQNECLQNQINELKIK